ncbi:MAG: AsnC family protein [Chloroflexota bacterium]|nr:MAG: AsnC family protein [Chloroflexota bacterium]
MTAVGRFDMDGIVHSTTCYANLGAQGGHFKSLAEVRAASGVHTGRTPEGHLIYTCTGCGACAVWTVLPNGDRGERIEDSQAPTETEVRAMEDELKKAGKSYGIGSLAKALNTSETTIRRRLKRL